MAIKNLDRIVTENKITEEEKIQATAQFLKTTIETGALKRIVDSVEIGRYEESRTITSSLQVSKFGLTEATDKGYAISSTVWYPLPKLEFYEEMVRKYGFTIEDVIRLYKRLNE